MDTTPLINFSAPSVHSFRPILSSKPILSNAYELRPRLIEMVQNNTFLGIEDEDPYFHLQQFEETCDCLHIEGMSDEKIRWKPFPFTLKGRARQWYDQTKEKKRGHWGTLRADFCMDFYLLSKVVDLRTCWHRILARVKKGDFCEGRMADSKEKTKGCTGLDRPVEVWPMD